MGENHQREKKITKERKNHQREKKNHQRGKGGKRRNPRRDSEKYGTSALG